MHSDGGTVRPLTDPGDQKRGKSRRPDLKAPEPLSLFDVSGQPPPTPMRVASSTSIDAAKEISERAMTQRRRVVLRLLNAYKPGLARFQIASRMGIPDHWLSSTIDALVKMGKIEEHPTMTVVNPKSGKTCAVLVALESAEESAA
jgi:hypothetical protein